MLAGRRGRWARPRQTVTLSDLIARVMTKEIDPIKRDQADDRDSCDIFFDASPSDDSQSHVPANDYDQGVKIKADHAAQRDECQRIPSQGREEIAMQECDRRACRTTSHARQTSDGKEWTSRPRQAQG